MGKGDNLGEFEQTVLLAIIRLADNAYGMTIRQVIQERTERQVAIGQVYAALERLEAKGYVSSRVGAPEAIRGGRRRTLFRMKPAGEAALTRARWMMRRMVDGLDLPEPGTAR